MQKISGGNLKSLKLNLLFLHQFYPFSGFYFKVVEEDVTTSQRGMLEEIKFVINIIELNKPDTEFSTKILHSLHSTNPSQMIEIELKFYLEMEKVTRLKMPIVAIKRLKRFC